MSDYHFKIIVEFDCKDYPQQQEGIQRLKKQLEHISKIIFEDKILNYKAHLELAKPISIGNKQDES